MRLRAFTCAVLGQEHTPFLPLGKTHSFFKTQGRGSPPPRACSGSCRLGTSSAPADPGLPRPGPLPSLLLCVCVPGNEMLPQPENQDRFKLLSWGPTPAAAFSWRAAPELRACQLSPDPRWLWPTGGIPHQPLCVRTANPCGWTHGLFSSFWLLVPACEKHFAYFFFF